VKDSAKKSQYSDESNVPVPETDTGGQVENTKGREITLSKELGKSKLERGRIGADACPVPEG